MTFRPRAHTRGPVLLVAAVATLLMVAGCSAPAVGPDATTGATAEPGAAAATPPTGTAIRSLGAGSLGAGFFGADPSPSPEATITPEPGSWDGVAPAVGYRVAVISAGHDAATATLTAAVSDWAKRAGAELQVLTASNNDEVVARLADAVATTPDLVIGAGDGVVDMFARVTPQRLEQQFLIIGAEVPEPTDNVTSVIWPGATFRGTGLVTAGALEPASVTSARAADAITAGVANILRGKPGIVLRLP